MFLHLSVIVFTRGVWPIACRDTPPPQADTPKETQPPWGGIPPPREQAGGTHPTRMHTCYLMSIILF